MPDPFVIAEFASTHDGNLDRALDLVQIAKDAGADAVKTAWGSDPARIAARMHTEVTDAHRLVCFPRAWLSDLSAAAHDCGLEFLVTVDCFEDIEVVAPYVDRFKIASWGATDAAFINAHRKYGKRLIISTGTGVEAIEVDPGMDGPDLLLHCVSAYPAPLDECNLAVIQYGGYDGFSDHTANHLTGALAVCAGAEVLEVHFRHYETSPANPDYAVSLIPANLHTYIKLARQAWRAMGDGVKRAMPSEAPNVKYRYMP